MKNQIKGKWFAFTGEIGVDNHERHTNAGGLTRITVTADYVDYLVVGKYAERKALNWATARNITKVSERTFMRMLQAAEVIQAQDAISEKTKAAKVGGKIFCFSGFSIAEVGAWTQRIEQVAGEVQTRVTERTDYMVLGFNADPKKLQAAKRHKTRIISENDLHYILLGKDPAKKPNLTIEQMAEAVHAHGGQMTVSLVPNDLFGHVKQMYFKGRNWHTLAPHWTGYYTVAMANAFSRFAPYMLCIYGNFFLDTKRGHARVTTISDDGIRYELLDGNEYVWLTTMQDIKAHELKEQKPIL